MRRIRVIPVLLLHKGGLVKTVKFKNPTYVGDPINAVKIFNEKEIDEIAVIDIDATLERRGPDMQRISEIAGEAFIPLAYGGGISTIDQVRQLFYLGVEKIILNHQAFKSTAFITQAASMVGSQSVVVSIDVKKNLFGKYRVYIRSGMQQIHEDPVSYALKMQEAGAGEIFLNSIDRDGTYGGYDLNLVRQVSSVLRIPLIACGGAAEIADFTAAVQHGASAVAAGSMFVFQRPHRAVLISYPGQDELRQEVFQKI